MTKLNLTPQQQAVVENSPAETAGLQVNDIITKAGEKEITGRSDLSKIISETAYSRSCGDTRFFLRDKRG